MAKYTALLEILRNCADQSSAELTILSKKLNKDSSLKLLENFKINYEVQAEGIYIDLSKQPLKIFKTRESASKHLSEIDFILDIIVLEGNPIGSEVDSVFEPKCVPSSKDFLFDNILFFHKFKSLFINEEIASYDDEIFCKLIFLSNKHGKVYVNYNQEWVSDYYNSDNDIKRQYQTVCSQISQSKEYVEFFRESYIEYAKNIPDKDRRFVKTLEAIPFIIESAKRNFELYKHSFSFSEFKNQFDKDKERYLKEYQTNLSDLISKIASMPVQFGVYIYLIVRFGDDFIPILATALLILTWSIFKAKAISRIFENVEYLKREFSNDFRKLISESGIGEEDISEDKEQISKRFDKTLSLIKAYKFFIIIFSICALAICLHFILDIFCADIYSLCWNSPRL